MSEHPTSPFGKDTPDDLPAFDRFIDEFEDDLPELNFGGSDGNGMDPEMLKLKAQMWGAEAYIQLANQVHDAREALDEAAEAGRSAIRQSPLPIVGGAFATGLILTAIFRRL